MDLQMRETIIYVLFFSHLRLQYILIWKVTTYASLIKLFSFSKDFGRAPLTSFKSYIILFYLFYCLSNEYFPHKTNFATWRHCSIDHELYSCSTKCVSFTSNALRKVEILISIIIYVTHAHKTHCKSPEYFLRCRPINITSQ